MLREDKKLACCNQCRPEPVLACLLMLRQEEFQIIPANANRVQATETFLTRDEIFKVAKELGIVNARKMKKQEIFNAITKELGIVDAREMTKQEVLTLVF